MANPNPPEANRFKPGQSGNPNGRPKKGKILDDAILEILGAEKVEVRYRIRQKNKSGEIKEKVYVQAVQADDNKNMAYLVAARLITEALRGDVSAIKELANRAGGRPVQAITTEEEGGFKVHITYDPIENEPKQLEAPKDE